MLMSGALTSIRDNECRGRIQELSVEHIAWVLMPFEITLDGLCHTRHGDKASVIAEMTLFGIQNEYRKSGSTLCKEMSIDDKE